MESVEEPADFLDKVNARLDRDFSKGGIVRRLFRPWRIKIPLEMAAAAAVIALIVYLGGVKEPEPLYQITITESDELSYEDYDAEKPETGKFKATTPTEDAIHITEQGADLPSTSLEEKRDKKGEAKIEAAPDEPEPDKIAREAQKSVPAEGKREKTDGITPKAAPAERVLDKTSIVFKESTPVMRGLEKSEKIRAMSTKGPKREVSLQDAIRSLGGNVIEVEYLEGTEIPLRMLIEIPVGKFESLIQELTQRGELQAPPAQIKRKADELIRVELIFQRSAP
jgi:hypothetical protein